MLLHDCEDLKFVIFILNWLVVSMLDNWDYIPSRGKVCHCSQTCGHSAPYPLGTNKGSQCGV
jgi:hypothetical protein